MPEQSYEHRLRRDRALQHLYDTRQSHTVAPIDMSQTSEVLGLAAEGLALAAEFTMQEIRRQASKPHDNPIFRATGEEVSKSVASPPGAGRYDRAVTYAASKTANDRMFVENLVVFAEQELSGMLSDPAECLVHFSDDELAAELKRRVLAAPPVGRKPVGNAISNRHAEYREILYAYGFTGHEPGFEPLVDAWVKMGWTNSKASR